MKINTKKIWTHVAAVAICFVVACIYFYPILGGKALLQGDIQSSSAMSYEQEQYLKATGEHTHWAPAMFSGMPSYQIHNEQQHSVFTAIKEGLIMRNMGWHQNIAIVFLYLLGFYIALVALGVNPWLSLLGALAFGLGSYNIIIIEAGHVTKGWAISMIAPILAGMLLIFKRKYVWGAILFTLATGLQITFNHIQITYYTVIIAVILGIVYFIYAIRDRQLKQFFTGVGVLLIGCVFVLATNSRHLLVNQDYAKYTMRGGSEITVTPEDLYKDGEPKSIAGETSGLNIDYAYSWSYGKGETFTLLVPGLYGGGSGERVGKNSEFYRNFRSEQAPLYWGDQPFTSGPVYFGAIIIFLFIAGLFLVKGPERWWLLIATVLAIMMSWGKNLFGFNEFLFNNLPFYNKFRTPSMSLVIANVTMVIMAVLALKAIFDAKNNPQKEFSADDRRKINVALYASAGITAGLCLIFVLFAGAFSYTGLSDEQMAMQYGNNWQYIQDALFADRKSLLIGDSWRSLLLIVIAAAALWLFVNDKFKKMWPAVTILIALVVFDLWGVDKRYLNENNFVNKNALQLYPTEDDMAIDQYATQFGDEDYRVLNLACNTFNDAKPSAFHHQIGGYSAAKLRRYQDIIDFYISRHINPEVLNMLNTRYFVIPDGKGGTAIQRNVAALGNAWFVDKYILAENTNAEILALNELKPADTAVVGNDFADFVKGKDLSRDSNSVIEMQHQKPYNPDYVVYKSKTAKDQLAVFSEIFYAPDWVAYIDGQKADYFRANYILRAMIVPAGEHTIEFRNEAPLQNKMDKVTMVSSIVMLLAIAASLVIYYRREKENAENENTDSQTVTK